MNIPEIKNIEVFLNGEWNNFLYIGSYDVLYGSMGMELIQFVFPENVNNIDSWVSIKDKITPVNLLNHLMQLNDLKSNRGLEVYGERFYNNFLSLSSNIKKLNSLLLDEQELRHRL